MVSQASKVGGNFICLLTWTSLTIEISDGSSVSNGSSCPLVLLIPLTTVLEGILTVIIAVASFWMLFDYPDTASFMTLPEREFIKRRLREDSDGLSTRFDKKFILQSAVDWKTWAFR